MFIDTHAHLDMTVYDNDRSEVIERAVQGGVTRIITIGIDAESSFKALALARTYDFMFASVGLHPHEADGHDPQKFDEMAQLCSDKNIVAWGEIGLDFFRLLSSKKVQLEAFERQLRMADDLNLPVIIHDRAAHDDVYRILRHMGKGQEKGVIHCFSGDTDLAEAFMALGYYISIPGTVTYNKAATIREVATRIPLDRILIETDAPFLSPVPKRGKRNEPLFVKHTAEEIARLRDMDVEDIGRITTENANRLFGLPSVP